MAKKHTLIAFPGGKKTEPSQPPTELETILSAIRALYLFDRDLVRGMGVAAEGALRDYYNSKRPTPLYDAMCENFGIAP